MSPIWLAYFGRLPLRVMLPLFLIVFSVAISVWNYTFDSIQSKNTVIERSQRNLVQELNRLQGHIESAVRRAEWEQVRAEIGGMAADPGVVSVFLFDDKNLVLAALNHSDIGSNANKVLSDSGFATEVDSTVFTDVRRRYSGVVKPMNSGEQLIGIYPFQIAGDVSELRPSRVGLLYVQRDLRRMLQTEERQEQIQALLTAAGMMLAAFVVWVFLHFLVSRRIEKLISLAIKYSRGEWSEKNPLLGTNELAMVGNAMQSMAEGLAVREIQLRRNELSLRKALDAARMCTWQWDMRTNEMEWSDGIYVLLGISRENFERSLMGFLRLLSSSDAARLQQAISRAISSTGTLEVETKVVTDNGEVRWFAMRGDVTRQGSETKSQITGLIWDVSERKKSQDAIFEAKERAEVTLQSIGDGVITTDEKGNVDYINPIAESLTGWGMGEAAGKPLDRIFVIVNEFSYAKVENPVDVVLREGRIVGLANHTVLITRDGREIAIEDSAAPIRDRMGKITGVVLVFHDVTKSRELAHQLSWQASHDALTGLVNRREFENRLSQALTIARSEKLQHALLYVDLDQFKVVNDTSGHAAGDQLLKQLSSLIQNRLRSTDTLARLGGDEFGILLPNCPVARAEQIGEVVRNVVRDFRFVWDRKSFEVSASIGIVAIGPDARDMASILSAADMACYAAKEAGRNRIQIYHDKDHKLRKRHGEMLWLPEINRALQENSLLLYSQRIVPARASLQGGMAEVLVRLRNESGQIVPPGAFLPAAERYNLMPAIDRWVVSTLLSYYGDKVAANGDNKDSPFKYSVNLSGATLTDKGFLDFVQEQFAKTSVPCSSICFEITETAAISNLKEAIMLIESLRGMGCAFALDDFGAGLSSFGYLKNLPVDYLKIDGNLIKNIVNNPLDHAMVESINGIGHVMGLHTIAEFVEDDQIMRKMTDMGVDFLQGYSIERPHELAH